MVALGYGAKNTYNRYCFEESSPVSNLFLGLKYMIERDGKDKTSVFLTDVHHYGDVHLVENNAYLPLAFLAENELADLDFATSKGTFPFQNELFTAATGLEAEVWTKLEGNDLTIIPNDVTLTDSNSSGYCAYTDCKSGSNVTYSYVADRDGFMCIHLNLPKRNDYYVSINGTELFKETISLPQMMAVGDVQTGDIIDVRIVCDAGESSTMTVSGAILNEERFHQGYDVLNEATWNLTAFRSTYVAGTILCDRDGLMYTSIPQNGYWHAYVDGKPAEITLVGDCMAAIALTAGAHTVEMRYQNDAFSLGWKISLVCAAIFMSIVQVIYKPDWKKYFPRQTKGKYQK